MKTRTQQKVKLISSYFLLLLLFHLPQFLLAQEEYLQGYESTISGNNFSYHSPLPDVGQCLLVRATNEYAPIEWQTEIVPIDYQGEVVSFIWLYGIDVLAQSKDFNVFINDKKYFTFSNPIISKQNPGK